MLPNEKDFARFIVKCLFDPFTGCVNWIGGRTSGGGPGRIEYGSFWFNGRRWAAHRFSGLFIHQLEIENLHVDHICRNPLCMHHLQAIPAPVNHRLRWEREPEVIIEENPIPFYVEPDWYERLRQYAR